MLPYAVMTITGELRVQLLRRAQDAEAVAFRQSQVCQDQRRPVLQHGAHRLALISRFDSHVAVALNRELEHRAKRVFVFDEQYG